MNILSASTTLVTPKLTETRAFYEQHFGARPSFDCGWYVVLRLSVATSGPELCLMEPQNGMSRFAGGVFLNLLVDDADKFHAKLKEEGVPVATPLEDHPWGDRGFGVLDPSGAMVYCYHPIAPAPEFAKFIVEE